MRAQRNLAPGVVIVHCEDGFHPSVEGLAGLDRPGGGGVAAERADGFDHIVRLQIDIDGSTAELLVVDRQSGVERVECGDGYGPASSLGTRSCSSNRMLAGRTMHTMFSS